MPPLRRHEFHCVGSSDNELIIVGEGKRIVKKRMGDVVCSVLVLILFVCAPESLGWKRKGYTTPRRSTFSWKSYDGSKVTYTAPDFYGGGFEKEPEPGGLMG